jgi:hypothetical protein
MRRRKIRSDDWEEEWYEWLDEMSEDSTMPIPAENGARIMAGVFIGLGVLVIVLGIIIAIAGLASTGMGLGSIFQAASVSSGLVAIIGGIAYVAVGVMLNLFADARIELAYIHRTMASILQVNLRQQSQTSKQLQQRQRPEEPGETDPTWTH